MKKLVVVVMMLCFFFSNWTGSSEAGEQHVKLHIFHFKVSQVEQWDTLTAAYKAEHPHVDFDVEIVGGGSDWQTVLKTKFASGKGPDIFVVDGPALAKTFQDYLTDLSNEPWVNHVVESAKAPMTWEGKLMGMPMNLEGYGFIYNKALFKKAGIEKKPTTFSELRAAAEKLKQAGITPFGNAYSEWWVIGMHLMNIPFALQDDPEAFLAALDAGTQTIPDNQIFIDFQKVFDLTVQYGNSNSLTTDHNAQMALFDTGEAAMVQQGNWKEVGIYEANPDAEVGLLPFAINDDPDFSDRLPIGVPFYWIVNNQSEYVEEAKRFLNWLVSSDTGKHYITEEFGYIPAYDNISADSLGGLSRDILDYASQGKTIPWSFTKWHNGMYNEFAEHTQTYVAGKIDYQQMLNNMQKSWDKLK